MSNKHLKWEEIITMLEKLIKNSYSPYSGIKVAAILVSCKGSRYIGVNVENASYGLTECAERVAVFNMVANGEKCIESIFIASNTTKPLPPCGACRQVIREFAKLDTIVTSISLTTKEVAQWKLEDLLPYSFTKQYITRREHSSE